MEPFLNDDLPNPARNVGRIRPLGHSAPRLSPGLRALPLCRCAERPGNQILPAGLVRELHTPLTRLAEGDAVRGVAWTWGFAKSRRRPQAGGHSRSLPLRRLRPSHARTPFLDLPRQSALGRLGQNGALNFGDLKI
jgi:hypothetical protein